MRYQTSRLLWVKTIAKPQHTGRGKECKSDNLFTNFCTLLIPILHDYKLGNHLQI